MSKRMSICLLLLTTLLLSSCSRKSLIYAAQDNLNFNYNNIFSQCDIWLTEENVCFLEHGLLGNYYYSVNGEGKKALCTDGGYVCGKIEQYGDDIYMLEEVDSFSTDESVFLLKKYNLPTRKIEKIAKIKNCDNFLILDGELYYLEYRWTPDKRLLALNHYNLASEEATTICDSVLSFGVVGDRLSYISKNNNNIVSICFYDAATGSSETHGSFAADSTVIEEEYPVGSFTSKYVFIPSVDFEKGTAIIWKYSLEKKTAEKININGQVGFISYENKSFYSAFDYETESSTIFEMDNNTNKVIQLGQVQGQCGLFVGSDEGVYVYEYNTMRIFYFRNGAEPKDIIAL